MKHDNNFNEILKQYTNIEELCDTFSKETKKIVPFFVGAGVVFVFCLALIYGIFTMGFVGMKLWEWFVVPIFAVKSITWLQSAGLIMVGKLFTQGFHMESNDNTTEETARQKLIYALMLPWIMLLLGYIIHLFII